MPETPLLAVRCPIDVLDQIESEKNLTGRSKTDVVIDRLRNSIPSLAVTDRHKLPAIAAIYQVFTSDNNLLYIGITDNLKQDWESHPLYGQFLESDVNSRITWFTDRLPAIDPNLVKKYNSVSDTVNTDYDSHSENMISSNQLEYAIANSEIIKGIQSKLDDVDLRLNESTARLASCLSQRLLTLEKSLDDMEQLLRLQRESSITSLIPTSPLSPGTDAIETVTPEVSPSPPSPPGTDAIETVTGDTSPIESVTGEGTVSNRQGLTNAQLSEKTRVPVSTIEKWKGKKKIGEPIVSKRYPDFFKQWRLNPTDSLWYEIN